jgi:hypothetical protein
MVLPPRIERGTSTSTTLEFTNDFITPKPEFGLGQFGVNSLVIKC